MKTAIVPTRRLLLPLLLACAAFAAPAVAGERGEAGTRHLLYLPAHSPTLDLAANVRALDARGFDVRVLSQADESDNEYLLRVRDEVRGMIARGVPASAITVLGSGRGAEATAWVSAITGNRKVGYVMLGRCDPALMEAPGVHMSGRVLGVRDADDRASGSCRPLWRGAPKVGQRRDLVLRTGLGAALFDAPHAAWVDPVVAWSDGGRVDLGEVRVAANR